MSSLQPPATGSTDGFTVGDLIEGGVAMVRTRPLGTILAVAILTVLSGALEHRPTLGAFDALYFLGSFYLQFELTRAALGAAGLQVGRRSHGLAMMLGLVLLSGTMIVLGLALFVIPGLLLMARWFLAVPILIAEEKRVLDSLGSSWKETSSCYWPILGFVAIAYLAPFLFALLLEFGVSEAWSPFGTIAGSLLVNAGVVFAWNAAATFYAARRGRGSDVAEIFA